MGGLQFKPAKLKPWTGRYDRIPGDSSVLHVKTVKTVNGRLKTVLYWAREDARATCVAVDCAEMRYLTEAVDQAKRRLGGNHGGSFQINEFGQVLVPSSQGGNCRLLAGEVVGTLSFQNAFEDGQTFSFDGVDGLSTGDEWRLPYVGMPFHLSSRSQIYFWSQNEDGGHKELPVSQDKPLIGALRSIRRTGSVRFIVNPSGIVLTKRPPTGAWQGDHEFWNPVYVGRINYSKWFQKEW